MAFATDDTVSARSKKSINTIFGQPQLWSTLYPVEDITLAEILTRPSSPSVLGKEKFVFKNGVPNSLEMGLCIIRDKLLSCFNNHAHSESFWDNAMIQVRNSFATSLVSFRLDPKERSVIDGVVMPMLRNLIPSIPLLPNTVCSGFKAHLLVEDAIPSTVVGQRGRKAEVDIVIQLVEVESGATINLVPLEAKGSITKDNMIQLSTYLFRLSSAEQLQRKRSIVGFLITGKVLQMCFLCITKDSHLLPVILVSPPIPWMSEDGANIVPETLAILMACIYLLKIDPIPYNSADDYLTVLAKANMDLPMSISQPIALHPSMAQVLTRLQEHAEAIKATQGAIQSLSDLSRMHYPELPPTFASPFPTRKRPRAESNEPQFEDT